VDLAVGVRVERPALVVELRVGSGGRRQVVAQLLEVDGAPDSSVIVAASMTVASALPRRTSAMSPCSWPDCTTDWAYWSGVTPARCARGRPGRSARRR
jgi:hypothetical protein